MKQHPQVVDPFVVAAPRPQRPAVPRAGVKPDPPRAAAPKAGGYRPPAGPLHVRYMPDVKPGRPATVAPRPKAVAATPQPAAKAQAAAKPQPQVAVPAKRPWSFEERETWRDRPGRTVTLAAGGLLLGGMSLFSVELGQLALAVYAIVAIWKRWPSRQAFAIALGMFGGIIVTSLVAAWQPLADNLAVYAFLLLCVGTILLAFEVRRDAKAT